MSSEVFVAKDFIQEFEFKTPKILFITTAANKDIGDKKWLENSKQGLIKAGFDITEYDIENKCIEDFKIDINKQKFDGIHFSGGDTAYLIQQIRLSEFDLFLEDIEDNIIISGVSAGAIVLTNSKRYEYECLNYVSFDIIPHFGEQKFFEEQLSIIKHVSSLQQNGFLLNENTLIIIEDNSVKIID